MKTEDNNISEFNVTILDIILTPLACATLVNEILKGLLYQECQIPYPYNWMKTMVTKKRQKSEQNNHSKINFKATNHFLLVSNVFDKLETAMEGITNEFNQHKTNIKEILFVFGTTPYTARQVFIINISHMAEGHYERNHIAQLNKYQQKILRNIFLSQEWLDEIDASQSCTNLYIYIVKNQCDNDVTLNNSDFVPTVPIAFSEKTKHIKISLCCGTKQDTNCCDHLVVFEDTSDKLDVETKKCDTQDSQENFSWYKFKELVKGFKDCFIDKKSVSELW